LDNANFVFLIVNETEITAATVACTICHDAAGVNFAKAREHVFKQMMVDVGGDPFHKHGALPHPDGGSKPPFQNIAGAHRAFDVDVSANIQAPQGVRACLSTREITHEDSDAEPEMSTGTWVTADKCHSECTTPVYSAHVVVQLLVSDLGGKISKVPLGAVHGKKAVQQCQFTYNE
jgi:hypothetical protein